MEEKNNELTFWQSVLEYLRDVCYMLAVVVVLFTFCVRLVVVSGESMFDTLLDGDYLILVDDAISGVEQGDIVVAAMDSFRGGSPIVKRVIAAEGQTVDINFSTGEVFVDGVKLDEPYIYSPTMLAEGTEFPLTVEPGHLFLMGDNRMESMDSRSTEIGQVDCREILGKAVFLLLPGTNYGEFPRDFSRIGGLE